MYIRHWCLGPIKVGTLGPHTVLPVAISCPIVFSWMLSMIWNLLPFKGDFKLGKARSCRAPSLGCKGNVLPGWFDVSPQKSAGDVMHEQSCCHNEDANHQLPKAAAFWIVWIVSPEEYSSLTQNLMQIHCSTHSVWMPWPHSTHVHSMASTTSTD